MTMVSVLSRVWLLPTGCKFVEDVRGDVEGWDPTYIFGREGPMINDLESEGRIALFHIDDPISFLVRPET